MNKPETQAVKIARMEEHIVGLRDHLQRNGDASAEALQEIRKIAASFEAETKAIREEMAEFKAELTATKTRVDTIIGNVRAFGAGMAAAFTLLGTALGAGVSSLLEWFK